MLEKSGSMLGHRYGKREHQSHHPERCPREVLEVSWQLRRVPSGRFIGSGAPEASPRCSGHFDAEGRRDHIDHSARSFKVSHRGQQAFLWEPIMDVPNRTQSNRTVYRGTLRSEDVKKLILLILLGFSF